MREDARKGVYVENLSEVEVKSVQDVITLLLQVAVLKIRMKFESVFL